VYFSIARGEAALDDVGFPDDRRADFLIERRQGETLWVENGVFAVAQIAPKSTG